ncbi:DUF1837 domain-containing protein [Xanthomonas campestris pv. esculenti]|nr:DUF1837 domain-containing protein [Xanthomonas campestris pv. esculenti]
MQFEKLLDENLDVKGEVSDLSENSFVLSFINDFEEAAWRHGVFQQFIWNNIAETALSKRERDALVGKAQTLLISAARNLRLTDKSDDIGAGSELAEAVLYGIMRQHYGALPVVPKIFYKQNNQDNAKGADSVHITLLEGDDFNLWFGEAKFYNSIEDARLASVIASVGESLRADKLKKENSIICNVRDLDDLEMSEEVRDKIKAALDHSISIDNIKPRLNVPILLLHTCASTAAAKEMSAAYKASLVNYHRERAKAYLERQLTKLAGSVHLYSSIKFHIILFPVPDKTVVVSKFLKAVEFYKGEG